MASSPPASPPPARPMSAVFQAGRSASRMSTSSRQGGGSRASDDDGKTSVKVAVRVRPPLRPTDPGFELIPQRYQRSLVHTPTPTSLTIDSSHGRKFFVFDKVFGEDVYQEGVWEYLDESVNAFVQGYNVSVLAYGQSGSGKSYTMGTSGPTEQGDPQLMGVIPRAANALFEKLSGPPTLKRNGSSNLRTPARYSMQNVQSLASLAKANASAEKDWQMKATYVEIYNEQLRDLLLPEDTNPGERPAVAIREDVKGRILLTGLHQVSINSIEDLLAALNFGSSIRQTDSTAINAKSSRSHAVFSLNLIQRKNKSQPMPTNKRFSMPVEAMTSPEELVTMDSKLHFVDLAGSERLKNTGASGDRAKEGISINAGLASLGKVISQLSSRHIGNHISYRDSKLTRLLQDSLGGNAITYMIACVTPAEFHLSETLNTVQYAQRARAIQSKPQIQQVSEESDKQAVIDRLKAEVSFLRDQIQSSERGSLIPQERSERQNEREIELQNHLLDVQENYTALSQRHAKVVYEITKARDDESGETQTLTGSMRDSAVERLKRSNSFAESVEQLVLEYETTIQSLESSLSNTRSSLATSESTLLEKENKCAYVETINQQLQSRVQKLMDRETTNEQYLHTLEARLDGQASGDEKSSALVTELRKEIARIRENEAQCEDYISTLEERLAEADQDMEMKQRELDRLEHVVERQRSLGKLDNLLYEFDHLQPNGHRDKQPASKPLTNGIHKSNEGRDSAKRSQSGLREAIETPIPESEDENELEQLTLKSNRYSQSGDDASDERGMTTARTSLAASSDTQHQTPVQAKMVADKLENVNQELLDLRMQHESTVSEFDMMSAKYEEALRTLAELQDAVDEARHPATSRGVASPASTRPTSFLGDARVNELKDGGHLPSSRSLSSELSLAGDSNTSLEPSADEGPHKRTISGDIKRTSLREDSLTRQVQELKKTQAEKDDAMQTMNRSYSELQELHVETLDIVEELKAEVTKARMNAPQSPTSPVIRRKSSQNVMTIDRAHRSFASLRNIAADNLEDKPDTMQSFELNLNTAMHELHQRSERVQLLEAELNAVKKEMDAKATMISGLTRERSSMKTTSPIMDMSVMATMNDQLVQREQQMRQLEEDHSMREQVLSREVDALKKSLEHAQAASSSMPGFFPETPAPSLDSNEKQLGMNMNAVPTQDTQRLQEQVSQWQNKHQVAVDSMQASEKRLFNVIAELESSLATVEGMKNEAEDKVRNSESRSAAATDLEVERDGHVQTINALQIELEGHRSMIGSHVGKIARLEQLHTTAREQSDEASRLRNSSEQELESHKQTITALEEQVLQSQAAVEFHKHGLRSLHDSHSRELDGFRSTIQGHVDSRTEMETNLQNMQNAHTGHITRLESEVIDLNAQLEKSRGGLTDELQQSKAKCEEMETQCNQLQQQVQDMKAELAEMTRTNETKMVEIESVKAEKDRAAGLVDALEDQLSKAFEQQQATTSRMSMLSNSHNSQLHETSEAKVAMAALERQLESSQNQVEQLQAQIRESQQIERSPSTTSNLRKSASAASLPSPPPAIPLPPLPSGLPTLTSPRNGAFPSDPFPTPPANTSQPQQQSESLLASHAQNLAERDAHIKQMEKHLFAEKQLTATLEEALVDLENQGKKTKLDMETYKKKCWSLEDEMGALKKERKVDRYSLQAVEEEKGKRLEAERAREKLEERMKAVTEKKKKKGGGFNCF